MVQAFTLECYYLLVDTFIDSLPPRRMVDGALAGLRVTVEVDHELTEQTQRQTLTQENIPQGVA